MIVILGIEISRDYSSTHFKMDIYIIITLIYGIQFIYQKLPDKWVKVTPIEIPQATSEPLVI